MEHDQDFSKLRNLLALKKLEMPMDTQVDQFLTEFHHRQRAQLLRPATPWARAFGWVQEKIAGLELVPTLSYGSAAAALAIVAFVGLSQQVQVTQEAGQPFSLSFRMAPHDSSFALIPTSFTSSEDRASAKLAEGQTFTPSRSDSSTTRFVLANNSPRAYDATVAF
jgi:hypothetical protein